MHPSRIGYAIRYVSSPHVIAGGEHPAYEKHSGP
jgi:hypothetical protein